MMKLNDLFYFVQVVDHGGFAAASRALRLPKSSISKRIAALEDDLGVRLIHRTTRQFAVTETGTGFYCHAKAALIEAEAAEETVRQQLGEPRGLVRLTASAAIVQMALADLIPEIAALYPRIQIGLVTTNRYVDLVQENFDIAIRAHRTELPNSEYVQRRLGFSPNYLVASPAYLAEYGTPSEPEGLRDHFGIFVDAMRSHKPTWRLCRQDDAGVDVPLIPKLFADDPLVSLNAALAGAAIANLPHGLCWPHIESGRLVRLLPDWRTGGTTTTILMPHRRGQLPSVRAVVDHLAKGLTHRLTLSDTKSSQNVRVLYSSAES